MKAFFQLIRRGKSQLVPEIHDCIHDNGEELEECAGCIWVWNRDESCF